MIDTAYEAHTGIRRAQTLALGALVVGALLVVIGFLLDGGIDQVLRSYTTGFLYWLAVSLGCLGLLLIQHVSGGVWGATLRRYFEAGAANLVVMAAFFAPIWLSVVLGNDAVYPWVNEELMHESETLERKQWFLNVPTFAVLSILYFAFCIFVALRLRRFSREQDANPDREVTRRIVRFAAPMLVAWVVVMTLLGTHLVMSLEPEWYSTIFPVIYGEMGVYMAMAIGVIWLTMLTYRGPLRRVIGAEHFHDLGNWLLAFTILWAYVNLAQFLIIWSGNLPFEITYYAHRLRGGWEYVGYFLMAVGFFGPFLLLLSRPLKRNGRTLLPVALLVLLNQLVYTVYLTIPSFHQNGVHLSLMDLGFPVLIGGVWAFFLLRTLQSAPLLPLNVMPERHPREHNILAELEHARH